MRPSAIIFSAQSCRASTVREICSSSRWMRRKSASSSGSMLPSAEMSMRQPRSRSSVLRVQHLEHDGRKLLRLDLRHIFLPDGAGAGAVGIAERRLFIPLRHAQHLVRPRQGALAFDALDALRRDGLQQLRRPLAGKAQLLAGQLIGRLVLSGGGSTHGAFLRVPGGSAGRKGR